MTPKHRPLRAARPKASGKAFQALVDPPNDGNNLSFDGGDDLFIYLIINSYTHPTVRLWRSLHLIQS
jgi:hypothetical protein